MRELCPWILYTTVLRLCLQFFLKWNFVVLYYMSTLPIAKRHLHKPQSNFFRFAIITFIYHQGSINHCWKTISEINNQASWLHSAMLKRYYVNWTIYAYANYTPGWALQLRWTRLPFYTTKNLSKLYWRAQFQLFLIQ